MKRLFIFSLLLLSSAAYAKNKISMVTYFPVPYVAYSQVNTTDQMDIGLTSTCDMKLGCSEPSATLNATRVNLKGGKLNLDGGRGIKWQHPHVGKRQRQWQNLVPKCAYPNGYYGKRKRGRYQSRQLKFVRQSVPQL